MIASNRTTFPSSTTPCVSCYGVHQCKVLDVSQGFPLFRPLHGRLGTPFSYGPRPNSNLFRQMIGERENGSSRQTPTNMGWAFKGLRVGGSALVSSIVCNTSNVPYNFLCENRQTLWYLPYLQYHLSFCCHQPSLVVSPLAWGQTWMPRGQQVEAPLLGETAQSSKALPTS